MFEIKRYTDADKAEWNEFVNNSRQGTFLFNRDYMDYHRYRFEDHSLMIYNNGKLFALLPANIDGDTLWSHQGLTYGGLLTNDHATAVDVINIFTTMNAWLKEQGLTRVIYKPMPWIYQRQPSEEDLYALMQTCGAKLIVRNISSTIALENPVKVRRDRRYKANKAVRNGVTVKKDITALPAFWKVLEDNLLEMHHVRPVHTLKEITFLIEKFPDNIFLYTAEYKGEVVGGTLIFVTPQVVHTQYISASEKGKELHALDLTFREVMEDYKNSKYFDFGISNEEHGKVLNHGLIFQKEGFGGRGVCYDWYEYSL